MPVGPAQHLGQGLLELPGNHREQATLRREDHPPIMEA